MTEESKSSGKNKKPGFISRLMHWVHSSGSRCVLLIAGEMLALCVLFFSVCSPRKYDFQVGSISYATINATKDVVDEVTTEEKKTAAANAIEPTYRFQEGIKEEVLVSLDSMFSELRTVQQYGLTLRSPDSGVVRRSFTEEETDYALSLIQNLTLSRYQIATLLRIDTPVFDDMVSTVTTAVENSLNTTIREGQVNQSIQTILQIVGYKLDISLTQNILPAVLRACVKPNMTIDQEATATARENAKESIEPIIYRQGQNIIREGDIVTRSKLEMLRSMGLLSDNQYDYSIYGGAILLIVLSVILQLMLLWLTARSVLKDVMQLSVVVIVLVLCVLFGYISSLLPSIYILPLSLGSILVTVLINYRAGLSVAIPLAFIYSGIASSGSYSFYDSFLLFTMAITCQVAAIWFLTGHPQRIRVILAGLIAAAVNLITLMSFRLLSSTQSVNLLDISIWSTAGSLLSGVLAFALQPLFETLFRLSTPSKLQELTNPNQPLMKRMMIEAPGTYHHSIIVANLSEAAADKIGANPYLARAGGYYHDIGKLKRPGYFKENQMGDNPHDKTDPYISAAILTSHARDGMLMAQKERLPSSIQDIILQHHGDTPVMFFYHKALQMSNGSPVDIREFRYDGPRPKTKEAAIVMLADTTEAAVRSMKDPTPKAIDQFIEQLVRGKLEDGQLSDSPLTLRDIDQICEAFSKILRGVFHERIEYPTVRHTIETVRTSDAAEKDTPAKAGTYPDPAKPASPGSGM